MTTTKIPSGMITFDPTLTHAAATLGHSLNHRAARITDYPWLAKEDGVTDDTAAILAAATWLHSIGGGYLDLGPKTICITEIDLTDKKVMLRGCGAGITTLKWVGTTGSMLKFGSSQAAALKISGCGISDATLDCNGLANYGIYFTTGDYCKFESLKILNPATTGMHFTCLNDRLNSGSGGPAGSQHNRINNIYVECVTVPTANGIILDGNAGTASAAGSNTSLNKLSDLLFNIRDGNGLVFGYCDGNMVNHIHVYRPTANIGVGILFMGDTTSTDRYSRYNVCYNAQPAEASVLAKGATGQPSQENVIHFNPGNGGTVVPPTVEAGAILSIVSHRLSNGVSEWQGLDVNGATFTAAYGSAAAQRALMGNESRRIYHSGSNHLVLANNAEQWGININGTNGDLRINRVSGTGKVAIINDVQLSNKLIITNPTTGSWTIDTDDITGNLKISKDGADGLINLVDEAVTGSISNWPSVAGDGANWIPRDSQFIGIATDGLIGVAGASKASLQTGAATECIGVSGSVIANYAGRNGWGLYSDVQFESVAQYGYGLELAVKNKGADLTSTPYFAINGTYGVWLPAGGDASYGGAPTNPNNTAIAIGKNSSTWNKGIVFFADGITGTDGTTGTGTAIELAKGHLIKWRAPGNYTGAYIYSSVSAADSDVSMVFLDNLITLNGAGGAPIAKFSHGASAVNYIQITSAAAGSPVSIAAIGSDSNIDYNINAKGNGVVRFSSPSIKTGYTWAGKPAATLFPAGTMIHISDVGGPAGSDFTSDGTRWYAATSVVIGTSAVAVSHTGDTVETTLATITIPADMLGPNGLLEIETCWTANSSTNTKTPRVRFNGIAGTSVSGQNMNTTSTITQTYKARVQNRAATNSQLFGSVSGAGTGAWGVSSGSFQAAAADTTVATTVVLTAQLAVGTDTLTLESYIVRAIAA